MNRAAQAAVLTATVRTPEPPTRLTVDLPGVSKGATIEIKDFSREELEAVGADYTAALVGKAVELGAEWGKEPDAPAEPAMDEARPKAPAKKPAKKSGGK